MNDGVMSKASEWSIIFWIFGQLQRLVQDPEDDVVPADRTHHYPVRTHPIYLTQRDKEKASVCLFSALKCSSLISEHEDHTATQEALTCKEHEDDLVAQKKNSQSIFKRVLSSTLRMAQRFKKNVLWRVLTQPYRIFVKSDRDRSIHADQYEEVVKDFRDKNKGESASCGKSKPEIEQTTEKAAPDNVDKAQNKHLEKGLNLCQIFKVGPNETDQGTSRESTNTFERTRNRMPVNVSELQSEGYEINRPNSENNRRHQYDHVRPKRHSSESTLMGKMPGKHKRPSNRPQSSKRSAQNDERTNNTDITKYFHHDQDLTRIPSHKRTYVQPEKSKAKGIKSKNAFKNCHGETGEESLGYCINLGQIPEHKGEDVKQNAVLVTLDVVQCNTKEQALESGQPFSANLDEGDAGGGDWVPTDKNIEPTDLVNAWILPSGGDNSPTFWPVARANLFKRLNPRHDTEGIGDSINKKGQACKHRIEIPLPDKCRWQKPEGRVLGTDWNTEQAVLPYSAQLEDGSKVICDATKSAGQSDEHRIQRDRQVNGKLNNRLSVDSHIKLAISQNNSKLDHASNLISDSTNASGRSEESHTETPGHLNRTENEKHSSDSTMYWSIKEVELENSREQQCDVQERSESLSTPGKPTGRQPNKSNQRDKPSQQIHSGGELNRKVSGRDEDPHIFHGETGGIIPNPWNHAKGAINSFTPEQTHFSVTENLGKMKDRHDYDRIAANRERRRACFTKLDTDYVGFNDNHTMFSGPDCCCHGESWKKRKNLMFTSTLKKGRRPPRKDDLVVSQEDLEAETGNFWKLTGIKRKSYFFSEPLDYSKSTLEEDKHVRAFKTDMAPCSKSELEEMTPELTQFFEDLRRFQCRKLTPRSRKKSRSTKKTDDDFEACPRRRKRMTAQSLPPQNASRGKLSRKKESAHKPSERNSSGNMNRSGSERTSKSVKLNLSTSTENTDKQANTTEFYSCSSFSDRQDELKSDG